MSKYYDVRCLDCDEESGLHLNWGASQCRDLIPIAGALAGLAAFDGYELNVSVPGEIGTVHPKFFKDHLGHVLAPVSEYLDIDGHCNLFRFTTTNSTDGAQCRLPEGHLGEHDFKIASKIIGEGMDYGRDFSGWHEIRKAEASRLRALAVASRPFPEKLIRDRVPEAARARGAILKTRVASDDEIFGLLVRKLHEEADELFEAQQGYAKLGAPISFIRTEAASVMEELGDVTEVVIALFKYFGLDVKDLYKPGGRKAGELGGFDRRLVLTGEVAAVQETKEER